MDKKKLKFYNTKIEVYKFFWHNSPILINGIDINEIVVSNKLSFFYFKYFIGNKDDKKKIRSLCIVSPKISTYKIFDRYFIIKEENVFDKYDEIWKTAIL